MPFSPLSFNLIISGKERTSTDPTQLPLCFRQVENWANNFQWTALTYTTNWHDLRGEFAPAAYLLDPFGFVHLRGVAQYTGSILNNGMSTLSTLPPFIIPPYTDVYPVGGPASDVFRLQLCGVNDATPGAIILQNFSGMTISGPVLSISIPPFAIFR